jgi:NADPH:quinone reductase-like Zn-dependent oxidoreductase
LVHGASGGVGIAAVQFALQHGMKAIATAGTRAARTRLESNGRKVCS